MAAAAARAAAAAARRSSLTSLRREKITRSDCSGGRRSIRSGACLGNRGAATTTEARTIDRGSSPPFRTWPSSEHAAFAFAKLAPSPDRADISLDEFRDVIGRTGLDFGLSDVELDRVFRHLDENGDGRLSVKEFQAGRLSSPFAMALVVAIGADRDDGDGDGDGEEREDDVLSAFPNDGFDWRKSTAECYRASLEEGFVGKNASIRASLDYGFHCNYARRRQRMQDLLIRQNVILDGSSADRPWLVYTCGSMGAGKGYVLGWMSANGILPLERVSKIDPDAFKLRMPEWRVYQSRGLGEKAGTLTHAESSYIAEIAQRVAMNNSMNVWVDGSLRDYEWHSRQFDDIRREHPQYRIAILAVGASDSLIQCRLEQRARETGRSVPQALQEESARGIERGLRELTPKVDLIAHVSNNSVFGSSVQPELKAVSLIDSSGNWELIKSLTTFEDKESGGTGATP